MVNAMIPTRVRLRPGFRISLSHSTPHDVATEQTRISVPQRDLPGAAIRLKPVNRDAPPTRMPHVLPVFTWFRNGELRVGSSLTVSAAVVPPRTTQIAPAR